VTKNVFSKFLCGTKAKFLVYFSPTTDKLEECLSHCYPVLNNEKNCEICHSVIEASLFPPIQSLLVLVYRCKNYREEVATAKNMCQHVNATPKDLSVRRKFWLFSQVS
jgi:hypothetical protein